MHSRPSLNLVGLHESRPFLIHRTQVLPSIAAIYSMIILATLITTAMGDTSQFIVVDLVCVS